MTAFVLPMQEMLTSSEAMSALELSLRITALTLLNFVAHQRPPVLWEASHDMFVPIFIGS